MTTSALLRDGQNACESVLIKKLDKQKIVVVSVAKWQAAKVE